MPDHSVEDLFQGFFLERDADMQVLMSAWEMVRSGNPQAVVIVAEPGFGKTRLVQEFYRRLSRADTYDPAGYWPEGFANTGECLDVNPRFDPGDGAPPPIPWLWWGMRWPTPGGRNTARSSNCALTEYLPSLQSHLGPLLERRAKQAAIRNAALEALKAGAGLVIPSWLQALYNCIIITQQLGEAHRSRTGGVGQEGKRHQDEQRQVVRRALQTVLSGVYSGRRRIGQAVPAILWLDDAQHADNYTLEFVRELIWEACRRDWKLMVVATYWEREWREDEATATDGTGQEYSLAGVKRSTESQGANWTVHYLHKLKDQAPLLDAFFPGLSAPHRALILHKSDGVPLVLYEATRLLRDHPEWFVGRDTHSDLTATAASQIHKSLFVAGALFEQRFAKLPYDVRCVLGWGSHQGTQFLADLVAEAANAPDLARRVAPGAAQDAIRAAEHPAAVLKLHAGALAEFRQIAYRDVANNHLNGDAGAREAVEAALRHTLSQWIRAGRHAYMPQQARSTMYRLAASELREYDCGAWAIARLAQLADTMTRHRWAEAREVAGQISDGVDRDGSDLTKVSLEVLGQLVATLIQFEHLGTARRLALVVLDRVRQTANQAQEPPEVLRLVRTLSATADIQMRAGHPQLADGLHAEAIAVAERLVLQHPGDRRAERFLAVARYRAADMQRQAGKTEEAATGYRAALEILGRLDSEREGTAPVIRDCSTAEMGLARVSHEQGNAAEALSHYGRALGHRERLVTLVGRTQQALSDLSVAHFEVGELERQRGNLETAMQHHEQALECRMEIQNRFGESPPASKARSASLACIAQIATAAGKLPSGPAQDRGMPAALQRTAAAVPEESEAIGDVAFSQTRACETPRQVDSAGAALAHAAMAHHNRWLHSSPSPSADRDRSAYTLGLAEGHQREGDLDTALGLCKEALAIQRRLRESSPDSPEAIREFLSVLGRVADIEEQMGDIASALGRCHEAMAVHRSRTLPDGDGPGALVELSISLLATATLEGRSGDWSAARTHLRESLAIQRQVLAHDGPTRAALQRLVLTLEWLGKCTPRSGRGELHEALAEAEAHMEGLAPAVPTGRSAEPPAHNSLVRHQHDDTSHGQGELPGQGG